MYLYKPDGSRMLKADAVPTLFSHKEPPRKRRQVVRNQPSQSSQTPQTASTPQTAFIPHSDHSYSCTSFEARDSSTVASKYILL